jgi:hypothetical protein
MNNQVRTVLGCRSAICAEIEFQNKMRKVSDPFARDQCAIFGANLSNITKTLRSGDFYALIFCACVPRYLYVYVKQGCQMVYFQTKNPNLGKFWRALKLVFLLVYFMAIWNMLWPLGVLYDLLVILWYFGTFSHVLVY